jgi:flavin reductase (DIM6/NTAB) family NADH-FMN oxidoreductase RutF
MELKDLHPSSAYFYYPRPLCVVGVRDEGKETTNFVPVAWATPLASRPPLFGLCLSPQTHSHGLLLKTGEFTLSFLGWQEVELVAKLGAMSGKDRDKVAALGLSLVEAELIDTPYLARAYAAAECKLVEHRVFGDQTLFVGEVLKVVAREGIFREDGVLRLDRAIPILYLGANHYLTVDPASLRREEG